LQAGETISLHPENWVAYEPSVTFTLKKLTGVKNLLWGEGLYLVNMRGPGKVLLQMMPERKFVNAFSSRSKNTASTIENKASSVPQVSNAAIILTASAIPSSKSSPETSKVGQPIETVAGLAAASSVAGAFRGKWGAGERQTEGAEEEQAEIAGEKQAERAGEEQAEGAGEEQTEGKEASEHDDDFLGGDGGSGDAGVDDSKSYAVGPSE
jgi:hypothetical protein